MSGLPKILLAATPEVRDAYEDLSKAFAALLVERDMQRAELARVELARRKVEQELEAMQPLLTVMRDWQWSDLTHYDLASEEDLAKAIVAALQYVETALAKAASRG